MNTLKLYGGARSRASIVRWYLEEFAIPYEFVLLDMANGEHRKPEFLALNPFGKVPTIVDGDLSLWESGAILLYLAEKHGQLPAELDRRAIYTQWILFANSTLSNGLFLEATRERETPLLLAPIDRILGEHSFIMGDEFTVVDVAIGSILAYAVLMAKLDYSPYPNLAAYLQRLRERPAFVKSIGSP
ncbi:glutathione S-transferase family protein [Pannus brasiliensis CCIBt3594]|uniref:Glutathione S-transferase family protein n=1 Tax=Pannus brasiliensis CCIBt3594 TaxID=1427578 RepID=A0AAW9R008_9CHRO